MGYSISNTIVPLLSGPFFGRFGKWAGVTVIAATITAGIFVVWFGMLAHNFWVVLLGRTIYGLGGESVFVGVDILVTKWFRGAEIGFAYGLIQAAGQAGSFTALYSVPALVEHFHCVIDNVCVRRRIFFCSYPANGRADCILLRVSRRLWALLNFAPALPAAVLPCQWACLALRSCAWAWRA
jgi:MFS family permease